MSGQRYYQNLDQWPPIVKLTVIRCLIFVSQILYPDEYAQDPKLAQRRVVISDKVGPEFDISLAIEAFKQFSNNMPFTAYNIESIEDGDIKNWSALSGINYFSDMGRKGGAIQQLLTLNFTSFFNKPDDYWQAMSRLKHATATLTRLYVPFTINEVSQSTRPNLNIAIGSQFPIDIVPEISQGEYAFKFKTYLQENQIWDISHTFKIKLYDFGFSDYLGDLSVEEMIFRLNEKLANGSSRIIETLGLIEPPKVVSISPYDKQTGVSFDLSSIIINFNNPMKENDTEFLIAFDPPIYDYEIVWSDDSRSLMFLLYSPYTTLQPGVTYTVDIPDTVTDMYGHHPEADFISTFTVLTDPY